MNAPFLRLFNAIQIDERKTQPMSINVIRRTISNGYVLDKAIDPTMSTLNSIEKIIGISGEKANAAFHKSWTIVRNASIEQLVLQQIVHYVTTYWFDELGIYDDSTVYIPAEKLEIPEITENIQLTYVKALTADEVLDLIINLASGVALSQDTLDNIMLIVKGNRYDSWFVKKIENRELKGLLYDHYGITPTDPTEYLRYLITKLTSQSLLIKNDRLIAELNASDSSTLDMLLEKAPKDLASIFYRFKPLFLAMKKVSKNKGFFNRLRKQAKRMHKPLPEDYMGSITGKIKNGTLDIDEFEFKIESASIFRKIRLAYALKYRIGCESGNNKSIVYKVRSGRGWATNFSWPEIPLMKMREVWKITITSIINDIRKNVDRKTYYIPSYIHYALPATEKQFTGNFPTNTYITFPESAMIGIHWENTDRYIDLDLSLIGEVNKYGWDGVYRSDDLDILFSGDITTAPKPEGATELFYLKKVGYEPMIQYLNYFNFEENSPVDCKIFAANSSDRHFDREYVVDPSEIIASVNVKITQKQNILGLVSIVNNEKRFYFSQVSLGTSITSGNNDQSAHARKYLVNSATNSIDFRNVLKSAGAIVVNERPEGEYIDLSPEALDKSTIIDLVKPQVEAAETAKEGVMDYANVKPKIESNE